ncbi:hypothetical protein HGRIS_001775 [Hohenbuehelia grisea]|uniref:F-box domain-containing protein n=1 Tax=Hohenbuehelia grisea TaxID=104357 RepID=A0ABR3JIU3_9AGAR
MLPLVPYEEYSTRTQSSTEGEDNSIMSLHTLPYDLLLNIAYYLDLRDVHTLHLTCKSLFAFSTTRPVYRKLAHDLLRRCRALPLKGFQRLSDLTTDQLIRAVNKATRYELAWRRRAPRPIRATSELGAHNHYMDWDEPHPSRSIGTCPRRDTWYKIVSAPPNEEVDWLSPITSSYTLCATKSGKVVCWDVQTDSCLAEWNPGERWELWKCRVEFEERTVFFTMAKVLAGSYDDERVMEFVLMKLYFPEGPLMAHSMPMFSHVTEFKTTGVVMNVFLLDPGARLLAAFIWVSSSNTIGLYALLDWDKPEYVFIDTGIECIMSSNWSCILYYRSMVIHSEESDVAFQHFYPISLLESFMKPLTSNSSVPTIAARVAPAETLKKRFIFPQHVSDPDLVPEPTTPDLPATTSASIVPYPGGLPDSPMPIITLNGVDVPAASASTSTSTPVIQTPTTSPLPLPFSIPPPPPPPPPSANSNPFPFPPWYPESAHFVRQWWPSLPNIPRVSCTVVLLASHDAETHRTRFVLAQHYFRVPLVHDHWAHPVETNGVGHIMTNGGEPSNGSSPSPPPSTASSLGANGANGSHHSSPGASTSTSSTQSTISTVDDALMRLWYVSTPFEVVCVLDGIEDEEEAGVMSERPRPLVAVDFGHAVWIEYIEHEEDRPEDAHGDPEAKWLRFVTFPPYPGEDNDEGSGGRCGWDPGDDGPRVGVEGVVRTLEIPPELDLDSVETINIDQSQGAVILSVKEGKIFILCYE